MYIYHFKSLAGLPRHREFGCSFSRQGEHTGFVKNIKNMFLHKEFTLVTKKMLGTSQKRNESFTTGSIAFGIVVQIVLLIMYLFIGSRNVVNAIF